MTPETAIKEIEEATSDLQAFAALVAVLGSHHLKLLIHALAKVEQLAISKVQGRRK